MSSDTSTWTVCNAIDASENSILNRVRNALRNAEVMSVHIEQGNDYLPIPYDGDSQKIEIVVSLTKECDNREARNILAKTPFTGDLAPSSFSGDMPSKATLYFTEEIGTVEVKKTFTFDYHADSMRSKNDNFDSTQDEKLQRLILVHVFSDPDQAKEISQQIENSYMEKQKAKLESKD